MTTPNKDLPTGEEPDGSSNGKEARPQAMEIESGETVDLVDDGEGDDEELMSLVSGSLPELNTKIDGLIRVAKEHSAPARPSMRHVLYSAIVSATIVLTTFWIVKAVNASGNRGKPVLSKKNHHGYPTNNGHVGPSDDANHKSSPTPVDPNSNSNEEHPTPSTNSHDNTKHDANNHVPKPPSHQPDTPHKDNHHPSSPENSHATHPNHSNNNPNTHGHESTPGGANGKPHNHRVYPHFECPPLSESPDSKYFLLSEDHVTNNTDFLENFRRSSYDRDDETTYNQFKREMSGWKRRHYANNLEDGDTIYESASGLGLNLVMTLEILDESEGISGLVVYGNDYSSESVIMANQLAKDGLLPADGVNGGFCQGDSRELSWVPDNTFDLVFTGQVPPLQDPLDTGVEDEDELWWRYKKLCHQDTDKQKDRVEEMQQKQEEWFAAWVSEMIRIARPGVPVMVEQVSQSVCTFWDDWGGVDKEFWSRAISTYGWDVDEDSLEIENGRGRHEGRYNVFMRKNV